MNSRVDRHANIFALCFSVCDNSFIKQAPNCVYRPQDILDMEYTNRGSSLCLHVTRDVRLECFGYLTIQDLGRVSQASKELHEDVCEDFLWRRLYPSTFTHAKDAIPKDVQNLVNRPYRRSSIGWSVSVHQDGTDTWLTGTVLDYRNDRFLVRYDLDDSEHWERETMAGGAWFTAGKLRIRFLSAPESESTETTTDEKRTRPRVPSVSDELEVQLANTVESQRRRKRTASPLPSPRMCVSSDCCIPSSPGSHSWRCEAFRDRVMAPTKLVSSLKGHSDEVLCVSFSNDGNRLASCSRDGTSRVYAIVPGLDPECILAIQHRAGDVPCRISWSTDDKLLLVSTEARNGNIFDYDAHVSVYNSDTGKRLIKRTNIPFDVCAAWIPKTHAFIHGDSLTVSPRGTYHQTLAVWDCDSGRILGRFHMRFFNEAFVHLIQVSPDGNFLAMSCGLGDALSDTVRIVRMPDIKNIAETRGSSFEIRIPRNRFDVNRLVSNSSFDPKSITNLSSLSVGKLVGVSRPCSDGDTVVPTFFCGGAILGLSWSNDSQRVYTNTRLYVNDTLTDRPDLDNTLEIQEWTLDSQKLISRMKGAHGFTTKDCPFYLFLAESPCGDYIASGSEDCGVYIYHVRHKRLMRVLWNGHDDVVSMVSWDPNGGLLATASDDHKVCIWSGNSAKRFRA